MSCSILSPVQIKSRGVLPDICPGFLESHLAVIAAVICQSEVLRLDSWFDTFGLTVLAQEWRVTDDTIECTFELSYTNVNHALGTQDCTHKVGLVVH
jgi:hypothetical protein